VIRKAFAGAFVAGLSAWLAGAFVSLQPNVAKWQMESRAVVVGLVLFGIFAAVTPEER